MEFDVHRFDILLCTRTRHAPLICKSSHQTVSAISVPSEHNRLRCRVASCLCAMDASVGKCFALLK